MCKVRKWELLCLALSWGCSGNSATTNGPSTGTGGASGSTATGGPTDATTGSSSGAGGSGGSIGGGGGADTGSTTGGAAGASGASTGGAGTGGSGGGVERDAQASDATPSDARGGGMQDVAPPSGTPVFVAAGYGAHRTRSLDGMHWQDHVIVDPNGGDDANLLRGIEWANGRFVTVGNQILTSVDGATWTKAAYQPDSFLSDAAYINGIWVAAGGNGLRVRSTDGGITWIDPTPYYSGHYRDIAAGNGRFVTVGHTYGASMIGLSSTSADGKTWSAPKTGGTPFAWIAFGNGVFVAVGEAGRISVSSDGEQWTDATRGTEGRNYISFAAGAFLIKDSGQLARSPDGVTWTRLGGTAPDAFAYGNGIYVGTTWPGNMYRATDPSKFAPTESKAPALTDIVMGYVP